MPVKYIRYELLTCGKATRSTPRDGPPDSKQVNFDFFLPDFGGFTAKTLRDPFAPNEVRVGYVMSAKKMEVDSNHPVHYPSNQLKNMLDSAADPNKHQNMYGLTCYAGKLEKGRMWCYSAQAGRDHKGIFFRVDINVPHYRWNSPNPLIETNYFSERYGGIEITWWTSTTNMPRWREIDAQVWKFLDAWNVAHSEKKLEH